MKKVYILLLILLFFSSVVLAAPINLTEAQGYAREYILSRKVCHPSDLCLQPLAKPTRKNFGNRIPILHNLSSSRPLYYVLEITEETGFVVVAGDDRVGPIVGISEDGKYNESIMPEAMRWWFDAIATRVALIMTDENEAEQPSFLPSEKGFPTNVSPLVKTFWNQYNPYNILCPIDPNTGELSLTGCTATAAAQILYFWRYPERGSSESYYILRGDTIHESLSDYVFDYSIMDLSYSSSSSNVNSQKAVAKLMKSCGLAAHMNYTSSSSGGWIGPKELIKFFNYDKDCRLVYRSDFTNVDWMALVYEEIAEGRPIIYSAQRNVLSDGTSKSGHSFICDGYNTDGLIHVNWGWGGSHNGFFSLDNLNHKNANQYNYGAYNYGQKIVCGIKPPRDVVEEEPLNLLTYGLWKTVLPDGQYTNSDISSKRLCTSFEPTDDIYEGICGIGVFTEDTTLLSANLSHFSEQKSWFYSYFSIPKISKSFGQTSYDYPDGNYLIRPVAVNAKGDTVLLTYKKIDNDYAPYVEMCVSQGIFTFAAPEIVNPEDIHSSLPIVSIDPHAEGYVFAGKDCDLAFSLTGTGEVDCNGQIRVITLNAPGDTTIHHTTYTYISPNITNDYLFKIGLPSSSGESLMAIQFQTNDMVWHTLSKFVLNIESVPTGTPNMSFISAYLDKSEYAPSEQAVLTVKLRNTSGLYDGTVSAYLKQDGNSKYGDWVGETNLMLLAGDNKTVEIPFSVPYRPAGKWKMWIYGNQGQYYDFYINISVPTDIRQTNIENKENFPLYNLQGRRLNTEPRNGIFIRGGKIIVKKSE